MPGDGGTPGVDGVDAIRLAEWKMARGVVAKMDGTISGLRKYGFTFITAILAADSILGQGTEMAPYTVSPPVKLGVMLSTLVLISALYATDRFYRIIQTGARYDAERLEDRLGMNLTWTIGKTYGQFHGRYFVEIIYGLFAGATAVLGFLILNASDLAWTTVLASLLVAVFISVTEIWASSAEDNMKDLMDLENIRLRSETRVRAT
jgi:hypothetical protein